MVFGEGSRHRFEADLDRGPEDPGHEEAERTADLVLGDAARSSIGQWLDALME